MTLDEIEASWAAVPSPSSQGAISGRRAAGMPAAQPVYLAIDGRHRRHLLIQIPEDTMAVTQHETRGLAVSMTRFQVGTNPEALYVDLTCVDQTQNPTFCALAQDMLRALKSSHGSPRDVIINALARWRAFWSSKSVGMRWEDALGLFGELWFMRRWLAPVTNEVVARWQVTDSARHDFQWPAASVEVKTTGSRSTAEPVHQISGLEQLADPEQGQLFLFSLQVCEDALASNTLHSLVEGLVAEIQNSFEALSSLNDKLAARGYIPADMQAPTRQLRILGERLYRVDKGFPRITRSTFKQDGLPSGIVNVEYSVDMSACREWLVAKQPTEFSAVL